MRDIMISKYRFRKKRHEAQQAAREKRQEKPKPADPEPIGYAPVHVDDGYFHHEDLTGYILVKTYSRLRSEDRITQMMIFRFKQRFYVAQTNRSLYGLDRLQWLRKDGKWITKVPHKKPSYDTLDDAEAVQARIL